MAALLIGYARCSTDQQDLTTQRDGLIELGVPAPHIYVDHGLTGTNRELPGLREALAVCRDGDTLLVTKLTGWPGRCPTPGPRRGTDCPAGPAVLGRVGV
jgi:DNA invertase Pin-like site-specific DNA recombinase